MFVTIAHAHEAIPFKEPFSPKTDWLTYAIVLIILLLLVVIIAKKQKKSPFLQPMCRVIEKTNLANKTVLYLIEYQQQRFLLADNQQSLALHQLPKEATDDES